MVNSYFWSQKTKYLKREGGNRKRERGKSVNFPNIHGGLEDNGRELKEKKEDHPWDLEELKRAKR